MVDRTHTRPLAFSCPITVAAIAVAVLAASAAHGAGTAEQQCRAAKNKTAGKYVACRQNAEAKLATSGDFTRYNDAVAKCATKFSVAWQKASDKAGAKSATCLDAPLTASDFATVIDAHTDNVATALGGGGLSTLPTARALETGQTLCYGASGSPIACAGTGQDGELHKGVARSYTDNGDGTITDNQTGLMWEKLSDDGSIHDQDNGYSWSDAIAVKVAGLNSGGGFAGHTDWRVPNRSELGSLVNLGTYAPAVSPPFNMACAAGCTVLTCSCTAANACWSSTTFADGPVAAWSVSFSYGGMSIYAKDYANCVRAVRGGS